MNFFTPLFGMAAGDLDLTIRIKTKNNKLTVSVLPQSVDGIAPVLLTGTPGELDTGFIEAVRGPLSEVAGLQVDKESFNASVEKERKDLKPAKKEDKKAAKAKEPKTEEAQKETPAAPKEPSLFDDES